LTEFFGGSTYTDSTKLTAKHSTNSTKVQYRLHLQCASSIRCEKCFG